MEHLYYNTTEAKQNTLPGSNLQKQTKSKVEKDNRKERERAQVEERGATLSV